MDNKIDSILKRHVTLTIMPPSPKCSPPPILPPSLLPRPHIKLDVPQFDGQDPLGWIFKIIKFFDYQCVSDNKRLMVVSFYMEGPTLYWY